MDRVIFSYTPTVRTHPHSRVPTRHTERPASTLVITVLDAPDFPLLPGVTKEAAQLVELISTAVVLPPDGGGVTRDEVLAALPEHEVVRFACHGLADWADPSNSKLVPHDHGTRPLAVAEIARQRLTRAQIAYLSACSTTDTNLQHADEATHLAATFHLAGFLDVVRIAASLVAVAQRCTEGGLPLAELGILDRVAATAARPRLRGLARVRSG